MMKLLLALIGTAILCGLSACNTVSGVGEDVSSIGRDVSAGAESVSRSIRND